MIWVIFKPLFFSTLNSPVLVLGIPGVYPTIKLKMDTYIVCEYHDTGKIIYYYNKVTTDNNMTSM